MSIRKSTPANLVGTPTPALNKQLFDANIWAYGYDVLVEKAIECPCRKEGENSNVSSCQNCGGLGWAFINPVQTKAIITSINQETKYKQWSQELLGNISATLRDLDNASFMDRITLIGEKTTFSEVRKVRTTSTSQLFIFVSYEIEEIEDIFIFKDPTLPLIRLSADSYTINSGNRFVIDLDTTALADSANSSISVRYKHKVQYNILDIPHILRSTMDLNNLGQIVKQKMPNQYIARLAHYVLRPDYNGLGIIDNAY